MGVLVFEGSRVKLWVKVLHQGGAFGDLQTAIRLVACLLERITVDPEVVHGRPAVRGTRVGVSDVLSLLASGATEAEILADYPYLEPDDIKACLE